MMFSLTMVDYSMSFRLLSSWNLFWWTSRGDQSKMFLLYEFCCGTPPSCLKVIGGWHSRLYGGGPWDFSDSPEAKYPFPFFGIDSWGFCAWTLKWDLASGVSIKGESSYCAWVKHCLTYDWFPPIYHMCQFTEKPASERMAETRWSWETNLDTGIERMVTENYAFMGATQSMYLRSGN